MYCCAAALRVGVVAALRSGLPAFPGDADVDAPTTAAKLAAHLASDAAASAIEEVADSGEPVPSHPWLASRGWRASCSLKVKSLGFRCREGSALLERRRSRLFCCLVSWAKSLLLALMSLCTTGLGWGRDRVFL